MYIDGIERTYTNDGSYRGAQRGMERRLGCMWEEGMHLGLLSVVGAFRQLTKSSVSHPTLTHFFHFLQILINPRSFMYT